MVIGQSKVLLEGHESVSSQIAPASFSKKKMLMKNFLFSIQI
jgi:hypothetical protein